MVQAESSVKYLPEKVDKGGSAAFWGNLLAALVLLFLLLFFH